MGSEPSTLLLTCDLDDTLWPTKPVIAAANEALLRQMASAGVETTAASLKTRMKFARLNSEPLTYRQQRTYAIEQELKHQLIKEGVEPSKLGLIAEFDEEADFHYAGWLCRRHVAASEHLYRGVIPALESIRQSYGTIVVGAVTNGCGDPLQTPGLAPLFDFTVSAEDEDVFPERKPSLKPFRKAKAVADALWRQSGVSEAPVTWIHVGKDLVQDVAASRAAGARAIWARPRGYASEMTFASDFYASSFTPAQLAEKRQAAERAIEDADATIDGFAELPAAVAEILAAQG